VQPVRRERREEFARLWTELGGGIALVKFQRVIGGLQLGEIFDALADATLKGVLQRKADAGNADKRMPGMEGVSETGIEFGAEAEQTGSFGCGQFENTPKPGRRFEQASPVKGLGAGFAPTNRKLRCGRVTERFQQQPGIGVSDVVQALAE